MSDGKSIVHVWTPKAITEEEHQRRDPWGIFDAYECPDCHALTKDGICLNACHLSGGAFRKFMQGISGVRNNGNA